MTNDHRLLMKLKRRNFLLFLAGGAGAVALAMSTRGKKFPMPFTNPTAQTPAKSEPSFAFKSIKGPLPLETSAIAPEQQLEQYSKYEVVDDLLLPEGFYYELIAAWGDKVGDSRFGYNNDYLSFIANGKDRGYLTINFEYISAYPWMQTYEQVIGKSLPFKQVQSAIKQRNAQTSGRKSEIDAYALPENDVLKAQIREICQAALLDRGIGTIAIRQTLEGKWERTPSPAERRISGISGLEKRYLKVTGPAARVFRKQQGQGYIDGLGDRIIGTFANCAGGTTPWGTVLSAEENFQNQVPEAVYADGTFSPSELAFALDEGELVGQGNVFGLAGNKYGWIVEVDPANPNDYGTKHTWLGRYRHEAVGVSVAAGKQLAFYSGCDRTGGHVYKFVSCDRVRDPKDKTNSQLLQNGTLYAAKFNSDGTGSWIALKADTAIDPDSPSYIEGNLLRLPKGKKSPAGGDFEATSDRQIQQFKQQYKNLGDLYLGNDEEKQGAILIDAHYAANAIGATPTAPEDTEIAPDGSLYISFTSGANGKEGGPDKRIFTGTKGETPYEHGWVMHLTEDGNEPAALTFRWQILAMGGPAEGGAGFFNPDNLLVDRNGNLWVVTDMTSGKDRVFGNNSIWYIPTSGANAGKAYLFGIRPMECETTGPCFTTDEQTILSIQHPGEGHGIRRDRAIETSEVTITTTEGEKFQQIRSVPVGSNWPDKSNHAPPKPSVVAIQRYRHG